MKCDNCGAFFVRYPCPSCDANENKTSENKDELEDNALVRPSELKGGSAVNPNYQVSEDGTLSSQAGIQKGGQQVDHSYLIDQRGLPITSKISQTPPQEQNPPEKMEDEAYRTRVRETLKEVRDTQLKLINLIEKLLD